MPSGFNPHAGRGSGVAPAHREGKERGNRGEAVAREAETSFRHALEIARARQAKSLELRAATSLGRLLKLEGRREEARRMISDVYGWFTEGFDTRDLREARATLAELGEL